VGWGGGGGGRFSGVLRIQTDVTPSLDMLKKAEGIAIMSWLE